MSSEQRRFAQRVLEAFAASGRTTDQEVATAGGPSSTTMTTLRKLADGTTRVARLRSDTLRRIDAAAGWAEGTAKAAWITGSTDPIESTAHTLSGHGAIHRQSFTGYGLDDYLRGLEVRLLDTEERLDAIEARLEGGTSDVDSDAAQKMNDDGDGEGEAGGNVTPIIPTKPSQGPDKVDLSQEASAAAPERRDRGQGDDDA